MKPNLPFHEWLIILLLISALFLLSFVTLWKNKETLPSTSSLAHELTTQTIQVTAKGAVAKAGVYEFKKGAQFKDLLELCHPLPEADLSRFKPNSKLRDGQIVKVDFKEWMTVYLEGAVVRKGPIKVVKGTCLKDLIEKVDFLPEADKEKIRKARRLKDQEIIHIPTIKSKKIKNIDKKKI